MGTIDLPLKLFHAGAAAADVGQLIGLGGFPVKSGLGAIIRREAAVTSRLGAFFGRPGTIIGRPLAIVGGSLAVVCRPQSPLGPSHRPWGMRVSTSRLPACLAGRGHLITGARHLCALVRRGVSRHCGSHPRTSLLISNVRSILAMHAAPVTRSLIAAGDRFAVACGLVLI
jgi:hypothetical protein